MSGGRTTSWLGVLRAILGESGAVALYVELGGFIEESPAEPEPIEDEETDELESWEQFSLSGDE